MDSATPELLKKILMKYRRTVGALSARLKMTFSYPLLQTSLRSGKHYTASMAG